MLTIKEFSHTFTSCSTIENMVDIFPRSLKTGPDNKDLKQLSMRITNKVSNSITYSAFPVSNSFMQTGAAGTFPVDIHSCLKQGFYDIYKTISFSKVQWRTNMRKFTLKSETLEWLHYNNSRPALKIQPRTKKQLVKQDKIVEKLLQYIAW